MLVQQHYMQAVAAVLQSMDATEKRAWRRIKLANGIPFTFIGHPVQGPQCVTVTLKIRTDDLKRVLVLEREFALAAGSQYCRIYQDESVVRAEFTLPQSQWREVKLAGLLHRASSATIGQQALGPVARINWQAPHKAIFGATRSGKTTCLADIIASLARSHSPEELGVLILNPKNDPALRNFERLTHLLAPIANGYEDSAVLLRYAVAEMERRRQDESLITRRLVVVIDEIAQLAEVQPETGPAVTSLSQMAGGLGINLVVASQAANPKVFGKTGSLAKANFSSRIVFQLSLEQAYLATGLAGQHTEKLGGMGDGLAINNGRVTRFRAAMPEEADYARLPRTESPPVAPDTDQLAGDSVLGGATWQIEPKRLAYALIINDSATSVRGEFGGGTTNAMLVRDYARELRGWVRHWKKIKKGVIDG